MAKGISNGRNGEGLILSKNVDETRLFDDTTIAYDLGMRLLFSAGGITHSGLKATVVDLRSILKGLSDIQLLNAVAVQLGVSVEDLDENNSDSKRRERAAENFSRINRALEMSRQFITGQLKLPLPQKIGFTQVNSRKELLVLLKKVSIFQEGEKGLDTHLAYCALIKGALAALELDTHHAAELEREVGWLNSKILDSSGENDYTPLVISRPFGGGEEVSGVMSALTGAPVDLKFSMRDKTWQSIVRKFLVKPESNAKEAFKDEIAFRFKLDGTRSGSVARVVEYLHKHCGADVAMIANKGVVSVGELAGLYNSLKSIEGAKNLQVDPESNPKSAKGYAVLQLNGTLLVPPNGGVRTPREKWRKRAFEIQFVDTKRKPNLGLKSDAVYAFKKDVIIATRFFGSVTHEWLYERVKQTALDADTKMSEADILDALEKNGFIFKKPGTRDKYAATDVWERWLNISGLINDEKLQSTIRHAVGMRPAEEE
jgi:hypothetical protein